MKKIAGNPRPMCDGMKGENYFVCGAMAYLAECLGYGGEYNYRLFANVSGASSTVAFSKDPHKCAWHYADACADDAFERMFGALGRGCEYVKDITDDNRGGYTARIIASVDGGAPVLARDYGAAGIGPEFYLIVGYDGDSLYALVADWNEPRIIEHKFRELVFAGGKVCEPPALSEVYAKAMADLPTLLSLPETDEYSFGAKAFCDWAEQLESGRLADIPDEKLDVWHVHGTYLCMLGTNGKSFYGLLEGYQKYCGGSLAERVAEISQPFDPIFKQLCQTAGGFDMTKSAAKTPAETAEAVALIRQAAKAAEEIAALRE